MEFKSTIERAEQIASAVTAGARPSPVATLYVSGQMVLILWRHFGRMARQVDLFLSHVALEKPYVGAKVFEDTSVFLALTSSAFPKAKTRTSLQILESTGTELFVSTEVPVRPLLELVEGVGDSAAFEKLIARLLKNAKATLVGWENDHQSQMVDLLKREKRILGDGPESEPVEHKPVLSQASQRPEKARVVVEKEQLPARTLALDSQSRLTAKVYGLGPLTLVLWRHQGCLTPEVNLRLSGEALAKPYIGSKVFDDTAAFFALASRTPVGPDTQLEIHGAEGVSLYVSSAVPVGPIQALEADLGDSIAYQKLVALLLKKSSHTFENWTDNHQRLLLALLKQKNGSLAASSNGATNPQQQVPVTDGCKAVIERLNGRRVYGWAMDSTRPGQTLKLEFFVNGLPAGSAKADNPRPDLGQPMLRRAGGFEVNLRPDVLLPRREINLLAVREAGTQKVLAQVQIPSANSVDPSLSESARLGKQLANMERAISDLRRKMPTVRRGEAYALSDYDLWFEQIHPIEPPLRPEEIHQLPRLSVLVSVAPASTLKAFEKVLESLHRQELTSCRFVVVNFGQPDQAFEQLLKKYQARREQFEWVDASARSKGEVLAQLSGADRDGFSFLLRSDESLGAGALTAVARVAALTGADLIYADSDHVDQSGRHYDPELRPDFNLDLLLSMPYVGAFAVKNDLLEKLSREVGNEADRIWQYDLLLRATEVLQAEKWAHITRVLSHCHYIDDEAIATEALPRIEHILRAYLQRNRFAADLKRIDVLRESTSADSRQVRSSVVRLCWALPNPLPKVSIIIPTRDGYRLVKDCIESIAAKTDYPNYEIVLVDHDSSDPDTVGWLSSLGSTDDRIRVLKYSGAFNWSAINNFAASNAQGEVFCFLNDDTKVISDDWLAEMVSQACRPEIGVVGAKLLFPDHTVQHGGVVLGANSVAEHAFTGLQDNQSGYLLRAQVTQDVSAVSGACLVCRRQVFEQLGGFEMANLGVAFNDVDFCLRVSQQGYRIVWTPYAKLYHLAGATRGDEQGSEQRKRLASEIRYMQQKWGRQLERDPQYNPAFELHDHPYFSLTSVEYPAVGSVGRES